MILLKFTWLYLNLHDFTKIYMILPKFTITNVTITTVTITTVTITTVYYSEVHDSDYSEVKNSEVYYSEVHDSDYSEVHDSEYSDVNYSEVNYSEVHYSEGITWCTSRTGCSRDQPGAWHSGGSTAHTWVPPYPQADSP